MKHKILFVIADGLGDRRVRKLSDKTPLQAATKDNIRELYRSSMIGLMDPISPGIVPGSDTSHLSIFGVDPKIYYRGRGAFEAIGAGAELKHGDVAFRGNFSTVNQDFVIVDRRAGRNIKEAELLVKELNEKIEPIDGINVKFFHGTEHRVAVILSGQGISDKVSDTDPEEAGQRVLASKPLDGSKEAEKTSKIVNELTKRVYDILSTSKYNIEREARGELPANAILLRGAATYQELPKFESITGLKTIAVAATALIKGVAKSLGMDVYTPPGATGGVDSDLLAKADAAVKFIKQDYDMVFLHVKGTDAASHDGNPENKVLVIEKIDKMIGRILDSIGSEMIIGITGDHCTPVELKEHSGDPVPFLLHVPESIITDEISDFNEITARKGSVRIRGLDVANILLNYSNRAKKYGA
ncbi:phosphoglycerate mutase [Sulfolobales archaeon HS-7]|nr:phosphoglycerate mutase [Sulfolobales archaeon HS-7]